MLVISEDGKGNMIIKATFGIGKMDEEIIILNEAQYSALKKLSKEVIDPDLKVCAFQYRNVQGIAEEYIECLNMLQCHCEETLADMEMMDEPGTENHEEKRMANTYQRESCKKIKNRIWQQAKKTLKYKRYELRIYTNLF